MFERICIPPKWPEGTYFDLGLLAESLLFYGEVILIVKSSSLRGLLKQCKPSTLLSFLDHGRLKIKYLNSILGVMTRNDNTPFPRYDFGLISSEKLNVENVVYDVFEEAVGKRGKGRRLAARFLKFAEPISYEEGIGKQIAKEVQDGTYISEYIQRRLIKSVDIGNQNNVIFEFAPLAKGGFPLRTNLNFDVLGKSSLGPHEFKKASSILAGYGSTIADLSLWSKLKTEVAANDRQADILQSRFDVLLNQRGQSGKRIANFQEVLFDDAKAIRHAVNAGVRDLDDFYPILEKSEKFSNWLRNQTINTELIKSYYKEATSNSWVEKLPCKAARWAIFTGTGVVIDIFGAGGIGALSGIGLSALDTFVVDKLVLCYSSIEG